jgi:indolepyruvate ferredoxin oxidoreductase beta subunit
VSSEGAAAAPARPLALLVCALGGEGGGVLAQWLFDTALACGHSAQATSIPGVAQRTGATTYYLEVHPEPDAALGGRRPVFSLSPVPGAVDLLLASELLEAVRQAGLGMADAQRTTVIASTSRALTVAEKMPPGDGRVPEAALTATLARHARRLELLDVAALAREAGTAVSAVLLGALAAAGVLPFPRAAYEATIRRSGRGVEASLRGFALAYDHVAGAARAPQPAAAARDRAPGAPVTPPAAPLPAAVRAAFPPALHGIVALGHARVLEYQDAAYAALYLQRLQRLRAAEAAAGEPAAAGHPVTAEAARWLALWMAYDDVVRVADLKLRAARAQRVRREVGAGDDELVHLYDHFKPGAAELAGLLPAALGARLLAWDARRRAQGREPWALPLRIGTHTVGGALALRLVAALRGLRRRGSRYAAEQASIERWLAAVERGAGEDAALGLELARCGRLIKGYGSTNERAKERLLHIVDHLATAGTPPAARAQAVRQTREAALADAGAGAFDRALAAHGAPPRPLQPQPVRWHRRAPSR